MGIVFMNIGGAGGNDAFGVFNGLDTEGPADGVDASLDSGRALADGYNCSC